VPVVSYIEKVFRYATLEVGYLHMLAHVLYCLKSIGKISVSAYQQRHVIGIIPGKIQKICSQHNIYALLNLDTRCHLGTPQPHLQIGSLSQYVEKFLLLPIAFRALNRVLQDIVIIYSEQAPGTAQPPRKVSKVQVMTPEVASESMIQIAPIYKDDDPIFHGLLLLSPILALIYDGLHYINWLIFIRISWAADYFNTESMRTFSLNLI
jgi:hypothetical protein